VAEGGVDRFVVVIGDEELEQADKRMTATTTPMNGIRRDARSRVKDPTSLTLGTRTSHHKT